MREVNMYPPGYRTGDEDDDCNIGPGSPRRVGEASMSDTFDHEGDAWNSLDAYDGGDWSSGGWWTKEKKVVKCNKCGSTNVEWHQYPSGKWFLFTDGAPHKCPIKSVKPHTSTSMSCEGPSKGIEMVYTKEYKRRIPVTINRGRCPHCGVEYGMNPGTGDCNCDPDPD